MAYDTDADETLADLGAVPDTKLHVQIRRYGDSPARVALFTEGSGKAAGKLYPFKARLSIDDALALGRFLTDEATIAELTAYSAEESP